MSDNETPPQQSKVEIIFENFLWKSRFLVLLAVIFSLFSALLVSLMATKDIFATAFKFFTTDEKSSKLVSLIIGSIDLYLIGVVLLIFSFGLYELFISKLDVGQADKEIRILDITSLDDLKNRIIKVVIMVLIVHFFKEATAHEFTSGLELLFLALSVLALSLGVYFMHKGHK